MRRDLIIPARSDKEVRSNSLNPAESAERQGQMALIFVTLSFLVEQKRFHGHTIDVFKAVVLEQRDAFEVAKSFDTIVGNVYEVKLAVLVRLRAMWMELVRGCDIEPVLARYMA